MDVLPTRNVKVLSGHDDSNHGIVDSGTSTNDAESDRNGGNDRVEPVLAQQETKDVFRLKLVVLLVLVISAIGAATFVYHYLAQNEDEQFRTEFVDDAKKVLESIGSGLGKSMGALDSFAVTMVSAALMTNQTWPCVTIGDFAVRMSKVLPLSDAIVIYFNPVVAPEEREKWEKYSVENDYWVNEGMAVQEDMDGYFGPVLYEWEKYPNMHDDFADLPRNITRNMLPNWQTFPVIPNTTYTYNWDALAMSNPSAFLVSLKKHKAVFTQPYMIPSPDDLELVEETRLWADFNRNFIAQHEEPMEPMTDLIYPVVSNSVNKVKVTGSEDYNPADHKVVGLLTGNVYWRSYIRDILPTGSRGIHIVFSNPCTSSFTYQINGPFVAYLGVGDKHQTKYDGQAVAKKLHELSDNAKINNVYTGSPLDDEFCPISLHLYPSDEMKSRFTTSNPVIFTIAVIVIFAFVSLVFGLYDWKVERRQVTVMNTAVRSTAIVSSLFPSDVRDRLYSAAEEKKATSALGTAKGNVKTVNALDPDASTAIIGLPIANLYPETTVLFADISGFTAWSSERHPTQVFHLLESVYAAFDAIARRRGVFKVETIGDSYVAVVGLPASRKNHAIVMAQFAFDCRDKMASLTVELAKTLGPGTTDLAMRFGLNSGPTTAGVLRGEKARFQLFGDTVNTAARMESNGQRNKIQVSQKTADLICLAGKEHWLTQRDEKVDCKGKGMMTTFWCEPNVAVGSVISGLGKEDSASGRDEYSHGIHESELKRLVEWNVSIITALISDVMALRTDSSVGIKVPDGLFYGNPIEEIQDELCLLCTSPTSKTARADVELSETAAAQLHALISTIAKAYRSNQFHNFDHCSHVVMSTKKLLARIAEHETEVQHKAKSSESCTYGITTNPLAMLAIVFAALIHDLDHGGVSNAQLVLENDPLAVSYDGKSVAEQNSVDVAWNLLMQPQFADLRGCIFKTKQELVLFRQVVVNAVMSTDLFDQNLKAMREQRWETSFVNQGDTPGGNDVDCTTANRRATIIVDLIIQASDVSHTMQHFTVYKKWNMRLLTEMYTAYQQGRSAKDPTIGWYEGELWFFDNYVIPLAQKLRECHVFGVSCDEFLDYANDNRTEWEIKGREIVQEAKARLQARAFQTSAEESVLEI